MKDLLLESRCAHEMGYFGQWLADLSEANRTELSLLLVACSGNPLPPSGTVDKIKKAIRDSRLTGR